MTEVHNHINAFNPTEINPASRTSGVVRFMRPDGWAPKPYGTRSDNFGPRFGFVWRPFHSDKTVVRGSRGNASSWTFAVGYSTLSIAPRGC